MAIVKPSAYAVYTGTSWSLPGSAFDTTTAGDLTTASTALCSRFGLGSTSRGTVWSGVPTLPGGAYTSKTLHVIARVTSITDPGFLGPFFQLEATIDGGATWSVLATTTAVDPSNVTYSVPGVTDETLCKVRASCWAYGDGSSGSTIGASIFDIWVEGISVPPPPQKKASAVTGC